MRIGILTFHRAHNYGAMLQAYALYRVLSLKGHDVEFLSYRNERIESAYKLWRWRYNENKSIILNIKTFIAEIILLLHWQKRRRAFIAFAKLFLPESKRIKEKDILQKTFNYDALFFGSDQIWTTRFLKSFDPIYWGEVKLKYGGLKIAYAPSMELKSVDEIQKVFIQKHLPLFDAVSAREGQMAKMLSDITGKQIQTVLDPTLLCKQDEYLSLMKNVTYKPKGKYILVYQVGHFDIVKEIADFLANIIKCPIIEIRSNVSLYKNNQYKESLGPGDFVSLISNATFILSCSFHGTAFAVNFHKPFYSVLIEGLDSRVTSILSQIGLLNRGVRSVNDIDVKELFNIDYGVVEGRLNVLRKESLSFIDKSLSLKKNETSNN